METGKNRIQEQVLEELVATLREMATTVELSEKELEGLAITIASANRASRAGISTVKAYEQTLNVSADSTGDLTRQAGLMNKQFSAMNQTVFAFSDLIQDSTQFQYGFATGMRAISSRRKNPGFWN